MKSWKVALGLGAACLACCAVPIAAGIAAMAAGSSAFIVYADELGPAAWASAALAVIASAYWLWRRRIVSQRTGCACPSAEPSQGQSGCNTGAKDAAC
jgi:hypothetical protein